jgi:hypothetical protein
MFSRQAARITATIGILSAATITVVALSGQVPATSGATTTLSPVADGYAQDNMPVHGPWKDAVPALQEGTTLGTSWTRASTGADRGTASVKHQVGPPCQPSGGTGQLSKFVLLSYVWFQMMGVVLASGDGNGA